MCETEQQRTFFFLVLPMNDDDIRQYRHINPTIFGSRRSIYNTSVITLMSSFCPGGAF